MQEAKKYTPDFNPATVKSPIRLPSRLALFQRFHNRVMEFGADLANQLRGAIGPGAIGEQRYRQRAAWIDPQRGSGEAEMTERQPGE